MIDPNATGSGLRAAAAPLPRLAATTAASSSLGPSDEPAFGAASPGSANDSSSPSSPRRRFTTWREEQLRLRGEAERTKTTLEDAPSANYLLATVNGSLGDSCDAATTPPAAVPHRSLFGESLYERLQSRARPEAVLEENTPRRTAREEERPQPSDGIEAVALGSAPNSDADVAPVPAEIAGRRHTLDADDRALLPRTALAQRRVRVLQLLVLGWGGVLLGWLGTFGSGASCRFAWVSSSDNGGVELSFGLWKYSPVNAVASGADYCIGYNNRNTYDADDDGLIVARTLNAVALALGTYAVAVVWLYLIFTGCFIPQLWLGGVWASGLAGACQALSVVAFFWWGSPCHNCQCRLGTGAGLALLTSVAWVVFRWEMYYNMPGRPTSMERDAGSVECGYRIHDSAATLSEGDGLMRAGIDEGSAERIRVGSLELSDFGKASKEYMARFQLPRSGSYCPPQPA